MKRVKVAGFEAQVDAGRWTGDRGLVSLAQALQPVGGVPASRPDADHERARIVAESAGGAVLDPAGSSPGPEPDDAAE